MFFPTFFPAPMSFARWLPLTLLLAVFPASVSAQRSIDSLSAEAQVSLITIFPGDDVYSSVGGHSALRVYDPQQGIDWAFNYGTFDFSNLTTFIPNFLYGKLDYLLSVGSYPRAEDYYWEVEQRPILEQVLNLTAEQREAIFRYLQENARPENRTYRYDFFYDNCSTRIRDVLEQALGEQVRFNWASGPQPSYRKLLDDPLVDQPWLNFGLDVLLGSPADQTTTERQATYQPLVLMRAFDHAEVNPDSAWIPLVAHTDTVAWSDERGHPPAPLPWPQIVGWLLFALGVVLSIRRLRQPSSSRSWFDAVLFGVAGLVGVAVFFLWVISEHAVTKTNLDMLWAWPTHLVAAVFLRRKKPPRWLGPYFLLTAIAALTTVLGWPFWPYLHPATFPLVLLLGLQAGVYWFRHRP